MVYTSRARIAVVHNQKNLNQYIKLWRGRASGTNTIDHELPETTIEHDEIELKIVPHLINLKVLDNKVDNMNEDNKEEWRCMPLP